MDTNLLTAVIIAGFIILALLIRGQKRGSDDQTLVEWLKTIQGSLDTKTQTINETLAKQGEKINATLLKQTNQNTESLLNAQRAIYSKLQETGKVIGEMSEIGRGMRELQEFLKSPKLRGNIGEEVLKDLISQTFPQNSFFLQYQFRSGEKVDVALKTDSGILPIDAKFPLDNYTRYVKSEDAKEKEKLLKEFSRDIKKHIDNIAKKYILTEEGTMDFALMYIPSETVFYDVCKMPEIMDFAKKRRVYLVSPTTLYAHLQMILLSFEGRKIEAKSREVFRLLRAVRLDYEKVENNLSTLNRHVSNAYAQMSNVMSGLAQMGGKLTAAEHLPQESEKLPEDSHEIKQSAIAGG